MTARWEERAVARLPVSHVLLRAGRVRVAVRNDLRPALGDWLLARELVAPPGSQPLAGGRGGAFRIGLPGGGSAVVRPCRRGGLVARAVRETYLGVVARPWRELLVSEEARRRGVPTPEILAVRVEGRFRYRAAVVTAEIGGARTLLDVLRGGDGPERRAAAAAAGTAVARMHRVGLVHADLNAGNILIHPGPGTAMAATVIDLDRARFGREPVAPRRRRAMLARLARSLAKADPGGALLAGPERVAFRGAYEEAMGTPCAC